jgi:ABC-2 type transport system permease protein
MLMSKFLTLVRRDMADNRGALIITPLVIAAILLLVTLMASLSGNHARFGIDPKDFSNAAQQGINSGKAEIDIDGQKAKVSRDAQGRITITTPEGQTKTVDGMISAEQKAKIATVLPVGTAIASTLPLGIAAIAILFVLAGGLHDERKDRTILFWKSMPVTDLQTVGAKMVSIIGGGFGSAFAIVIVLNLAITIIAVLTLGRVGLTGVDLGGVLVNSSKLWLVMLAALLVYIGWALPVYSWMTMVSAWAPKMPFVAAFAPLIVVPLVYMAVAFRGNDNDPILSALWDPLSRLIGEPVVTGLQEALDKIPDTSSPIPVNDLLVHLSHNLTQPAFWLGIVVAGGFVYAASEIRRRRAL